MAITVSPVILEGCHVALHPIVPDHIDGIFEIGQEKADWAYLPISGFSDRHDAEQWVQQAIALAERGLHYTFVLLNPESGRIMGSTRYLNIRARDRGMEIGYSWLGREYQRTVVNTETKYLLLKHAFESLGAYRVEFKTDLRNLRSQKAIERIGAHKEGIFRRHMVAQGGYIRDSVYYSITDLDWPQIRGALEAKLRGKAR